MSFSPTVVKSTQQGTIFVDGATSATGTITAVHTGRTSLTFLGLSTATTNTLSYALVRLTLTNSTTITATRNNTAVGNGTVVSYRVVEYY